jgi:chorismate synthase
MNSFGQAFRIQIFGESHGPSIGIVLDGVPAGLSLSESDFMEAIERRRGGQKATTPRKEADQPILLSGVFNGKTTGAPICIITHNSNTRSQDYESVLAQPRPGHADWVAQEKFKGFQDYRGGGHFSGRLTWCLVVAGVVAQKILPNSIQAKAFVQSIGGETDIEKGIEKAIAAKDTIGGVVTCEIVGVPVGLGEPFFNSLESQIAHLAFSIPAIKGIEFGEGFAVGTMFGTEVNDVFIDHTGKTQTNHAGGINGGISNGQPIVFRVVVKPASSTPKTQMTWHQDLGRLAPLSIKGRHDLVIALRVPIIIESIAYIVLADAYLHRKHSIRD